ncbi:proline iminopeptidase-family hydrolase [Paremcibacter congregatus]|uniref:Proline iminopeptidase n=1 Tax=Paremcibacter congregatus TaxID=2043170 RepID=A0A2G4YMT3_9PROT|nr:proline iminopeptidase-family hydrolase [Paremcibacter congregatus]PHZ83632.1 proline iminopeptidase [Paremcibacter congregatus]QDE27334.1 alpha/beta fold hydrolase [Paremcibacter congregatus]
MRHLKLLVIILFLLPLSPAVAHQDPEIAGYINVDGGRIWYRLNGAEHIGKAPAIIVMHGGPGGIHRTNMPYVALADAYPVILYDQLGTGNSDRPNNPENWTVERFVAEIDHIRAALNLKDVIIAGHSWGGTLAAEYAARRPDGLKAAILSSPLISTAQWIADNQVWIDQLPPNVSYTLRKHIAEGTQDHPDYKAAEEVFYSKHMCRQDPCPGRDYWTGASEWNENMYVHMWGSSDFYATGTLKGYDGSRKLHNIAVPTLMICGEFDEAAPKSCHKYANMIPQSQTVIVPNAGHATMAENEEFYLKSLADFLAKLPE